MYMVSARSLKSSLQSNRRIDAAVLFYLCHMVWVESSEAKSVFTTLQRASIDLTRVKPIRECSVHASRVGSESNAATPDLLITLFYLAQKPPVGHGFLICEVSRSHTTTHHSPPLDEWQSRRRDLCLTTQNTHNRRTSMPPVRFEPKISAGERPQTYALDRATTGTDLQQWVL